MPPHSVPRRVEDIIYYYYAKLVIAPSANFAENYRFIIHTYKRLKAGELRMSDYEREFQHISGHPSKCVFCEAKDKNCVPVHVVPRKHKIPPGMQNLVLACQKCAESKGEKDIISWWVRDLKNNRDDLPRIALGLYLKIAYELHKINFSLKAECESLDDLLKVIGNRSA